MSRVTQTVFSEGIFHGLPTFPAHDGRKYTAIVTGANGISGSEIVSVLAAAPERWETIYAISRRPPVNENPRVKNIAADFLAPPDVLAALFKQEGVKADYIFFTSYMQPPANDGIGLWSNTDELEAVNVKLLSNFLSALETLGSIPKRFIHQTGGKHYALHLGPTTVPMTEDTPAERVQHTNFYFAQEDLLSTWAANNNTEWTVTRPGFIIGANTGAAINIPYALAIYAFIQKELGRKLDFPADIGAWDASKDLTNAKLLGYFNEWAALTEGAANQALNIVDDSPFTWGKFWPEIAKWYAVQHGIPEPEAEKYVTVTLPQDPPPRGFGPAGKVYINFTFEQWSQTPEVKEAWFRIQERVGLKKDLDPWRNEIVVKELFQTLDAELLGGWGRVQTMDKAKSLGWHGHVQTIDGFRDTLERMAKLKMIPEL